MVLCNAKVDLRFGFKKSNSAPSILSHRMHSLQLRPVKHFIYTTVYRAGGGGGGGGGGGY